MTKKEIKRATTQEIGDRVEWIREKVNRERLTKNNYKNMLVILKELTLIKKEIKKRK